METDQKRRDPDDPAILKLELIRNTAQPDTTAGNSSCGVQNPIRINADKGFVVFQPHSDGVGEMIPLKTATTIPTNSAK